MVKLSSKIHRLKVTTRQIIRRVGRWCRQLTGRLMRWWRRHDRRWYPWWRVANGLVALMLLAAIVLPVWQVIYKNNRYQLSAAALALVGQPDQTLQKQLTYDSTTATYQFNKSAIKADTSANPLAAMQAQVGSANGQGNNKSLYALDVPTDFTKGVTYHDVNSGLSFELKPQFSALPGKTVSDHLVFPLASDSQAVYTLKGNGLKEDIVVNKISGDTMSFDYQFDLPDTLAVKAIPNGQGAIGIYSADPSLFGNMSYGSDSDRAAVEKARVAGDKTYLVFGLPKPVVKDTKGNTVGSARYELNGDKLTVVAEGLSKASGPVTIDPSVVVTSTSDFQTGGNNESMIDFSTAGQINRGGLTGGTIGSWTSTYNVGLGLAWNSSAVYNGYVYMTGYFTGSTSTNCNYALLNSNGTNNGWLTCTSLTSARDVVGLTAYNGYLYVLGGNNGGTELNTVEYAAINSDGSIGSWITTTVLPVATGFGQSFAYNNYMYYIGGTHSDGNAVTTNYYAPINADGTLGSWTATTSLLAARAVFSMQQYNGYVYVMGGTSSYNLSITPYNTVYYAAINTDGTLSSWQTATNLPTTLDASMSAAYNGYLYVFGGNTASGEASGTNSAIYAQINANGTIGPWLSTTNLNITRSEGTAYAYNGYVYISNGRPGNGVGYINDTYYAKINSAGQPASFAATATNFTTARALTCSVAYNGYLYVIGGSTNDSQNNNLTSVAYTPLTVTTGQTGTWTATTALPVATGSEGCTAVGGYLYIMGGNTGTGTGTGTNVVRYISITSTGALGASWSTGSSSGLSSTVSAPKLISYNAAGTNYIYALTAGTAMSVFQSAITASTGAVGSWAGVDNSLPAMANMGFAQVGNYLYVFGGSLNSAPTTPISTVYYTSIASDGSISNWQTTTSMNTAIWFNNGTSMNGCIYSLGGENSGGTSLTNVQYACPSSNGTISAWYNGPALSVATTDTAVTSYGGYIYGVGGWTTAVTAATQFSLVNNGGSGALSSINTGTLMPDNNYNMGAVAYNGYVYLLGGSTGSTPYLSTVRYMKIGVDGSVSSTWLTTTPLYTTLYDLRAVAYNGYMYILGGNDGTIRRNDVYYAPINSDGTLGSWTATSSFQVGRVSMGVSIYNGYMYLLGGNSNSSSGDCTSASLYCSGVQFAQINSGGTLGPWHYTHNSSDDGTTFSAGISSARYAVSIVANGGYLYMFGGIGESSAYYSDVQYAPINADGTIGTWTNTNGFSTGLGYVGIAAYDGFVYAVYGKTSASTSDTIQYTWFNQNGTLGPWQSTTSISAGNGTWAGGVAAYDGELFTFGGFRSAASNNTRYLPMNSIPKTGYYSKLIDFGTTVNLSSVSITGRLGDGFRDISYRTAGTNGIFSASAYANNSLSGSIVCLAGSVSVRYIWLDIKLDDSAGRAAGGAFPDSSNPAYLADLTLSYKPTHPTPDVRLRGGKTLQQGSLSALDICMSTTQAIVATTGSASYGTTTAAAGVPTGVTTGSLLVASAAAFWAEDGTTPTSTALTAPSGWTQASFLGYAYTGSGASFASALFYKYATGVDSGTYSFGASSVGGQAAGHTSAIVQRISGGPTSGNPFASTPMTQVAVTGDGSFTTTSVTMPSFSVTSNGSLLIGAAFSSWSSAWSTPSGWTYDGSTAPSDNYSSLAVYHQTAQAGTIPTTTFSEGSTGAAFFGIIGIIKPGPQ